MLHQKKEIHGTAIRQAVIPRGKIPDVYVWKNGVTMAGIMMTGHLIRTWIATGSIGRARARHPRSPRGPKRKGQSPGQDPGQGLL